MHCRACHSLQAAHIAPVRALHARSRQSGRQSRHRLTTCQAITIPGTQRIRASARRSSASRLAQQAQQDLLNAISDVKGRGASGISPAQQEAVQRAVRVLEGEQGVQAPAASPVLEGRWRLLFTTRPGTASPIQRSFTGVDSFSVYQEVLLSEPGGARVNNIVDFGRRIGALKVEAEASTEARPLPGFTPRRGAGLPLFGRSESYPPARAGMRVNFQFDRAAFTFRVLPFKLPYPVPFKLLGDETKGWIDITYLSPAGDFRLTRGNKGTLFVLVKDAAPKDALLAALDSKASDAEVQELIDRLVQDAPAEAERRPAQSRRAQGRWRLRWSAQASGANFLQRSLAGAARNYQIIGSDGELQNQVLLGPLLRVQADATCQPQGAGRTLVDITELYAQLGPLRIPLPFRSSRRSKQQPSSGSDADQAYVDWLWLDDDLRVTRGSKGSLFVHQKEQGD